MNGTSRPTDGEAAAIAAALALATRAATPPPQRSTAARAWTLAMRLPELEIDDVRALARAGDAAACSTRS